MGKQKNRTKNNSYLPILQDSAMIQLHKAHLHVSVANMCFYMFSHFKTCGHSAMSPRPMWPCHLATFSQEGDERGWLPCRTIQTHPFRTHVLHRMCSECNEHRKLLNERFDRECQAQVVWREEWRHKVNYHNSMQLPPLLLRKHLWPITRAEDNFWRKWI